MIHIDSCQMEEIISKIKTKIMNSNHSDKVNQRKKFQAEEKACKGPHCQHYVREATLKDVIVNSRIAPKKCYDSYNQLD